MKTFAFQRFGEYKESEQASAMKSRDYKDATDVVIQAGGVRRLTPSECDMLQGFPKDWTNIGAWTDSKGKLHKESSDSARYKALGNALCLPFWKVLARRIAAQYERDITVGGLFSGIGGFEYVFQKAGANPVFSSEIDEFCNAVLKKRFPEEEEGD